MTQQASQTSGVAGRYATALFELALEGDALSAVEADLRDLRAAIDASPELTRLIRSPLFSREDQSRAMAAILDKAGAHDIVKKFIGVVAANRRLFALPEIIAAVLALAARHRGEVSAEVASASELTSSQIDALKASLKSSLGQDVALETKVDPSLLGGLVVKVGSRMVDSSLRTKLDRLGAAMRQA
ncbi:MAG: F0F1 ATP synthase subunit delta [Pseudomonadota bacterium]